MTGPDSFFADDTIVLKVELAAANGEIQRLKAENERLETENRCVHLSNESLRTTVESLAKWYEGQEGLRKALEDLTAICAGAAPEHDLAIQRARAGLAHHNAATPLWRPLLDCMGEE